MRTKEALILAAMLAIGTAAEAQVVVNNYRVVRGCGRWRWEVKTLTDADTALIRFDSIRPITVDQLTRMRSFVTTEFMERQWSEYNLYRIDAELYGYTQARDRDYQLFLRDPRSGRTMVAAIPDPDCPEVKASSRAWAFREGREWVRKNLGEPKIGDSILPRPIPIRVVGIAFYDRLDNQKGMAENGVGLHPVLSLEAIAPPPLTLPVSTTGGAARTTKTIKPTSSARARSYSRKRYRGTKSRYRKGYKKRVNRYRYYQRRKQLRLQKARQARR